MERGLETAGKRKKNQKKSARRQQCKNCLLRGQQVRRDQQPCLAGSRRLWPGWLRCVGGGRGIAGSRGFWLARCRGALLLKKRSKCQGQTAPAGGTLPVALTESAASFALSPFGKGLGKGQDQQARPWPAPCPHPGLPQRGKEQDSPARSARKRLGNQPRTTASASLRHHSSAA